MVTDRAFYAKVQLVVSGLLTMKSVQSLFHSGSHVRTLSTQEVNVAAAKGNGKCKRVEENKKAKEEFNEMRDNALTPKWRRA